MTTTIDANTQFQAIDGFGVSHYDPIVYTSSYSSVADSLWSQTSGIGISVYNCAIAVDGSGNVGPLYQNNTWAAQILGDWSQEIAAWNRGVRDFCVRVWTYQFVSPFTWQVGNANNPNAALDTAHSTDAANAIATFLTNAVNNGVYFKYVSPWNEPDINPSYPQISWTTAQMLAFIKVLHPILVTWAGTTAGLSWQSVTGLSVPYILWGESFDFANQVGTYIPAAEGDSTVVAYSNLIYVNHQYNGGGVSAPPNPCSHKQWMTECSTQGGSWDVTMTDAMTIMSYMYNALTTGNVSSWWFWWAEADNSETDNEGLLGFFENSTSWNNPDYTKRFYCFGNFSKFVRPGSTRISVANAPAGVNILSFISLAGVPTVVCINTNTSSTAVSFSLNAFIAVPSIQIVPWITDANNNLVSQSPIVINGGTHTISFSASLNATGVTTFAFPKSRPIHYHWR